MIHLLRPILPLLLAGLALPLPAQGVAMVAELQGKGSVQARSLVEPLALTAEVAAGGAVTLEAGSRLVLISLQDGEETTLKGPLTFTLDAKGHPLGSGKGISRKQIKAPHLREVLRPGGLAQASLVMRVPGATLVMQSPDPAVRTPTPRFAWTAPAGARFTFTLTAPDRQVVLRQETDRPDLELPQGIQLKPGLAYAWTLDGRSGDDHLGTLAGQVKCLDGAQTGALEALQAFRSDSFARGLLYAAALQEVGLRTEARVEWKRLSALAPGEPVLKALAD